MKIRSKKKPVAFYDLYRDGVTQGLLAQFLACPEKLRLGVVEGLSPNRGSKALAFGTIFHEALDQFYTYIRDNGKPKRFEQWSRDFFRETLLSHEETAREELQSNPLADPNAIKDIEENYGLAEILLNSYAVYWIKDFTKREWVDLERSFRVPYELGTVDGKPVPPIDLRGKIDATFRTSNGGLWLLDTKTKGKVEEGQIVDRLSYDIQFMFYLSAMRKLYGETPKGVVCNVVRRPGLQQGSRSLKEHLQRVSEDVEKRPEFYFVRYECVVTPKELDEWEEGLRGIMTQLVRWWRGEFHWKNSNACVGVFNCPFMAICGRNDRTYFHQREHVFPELV